jgi:hypothetical protein
VLVPGETGSAIDASCVLNHEAVDGRPVWAYRYRTDGPSPRRLQRGGFSSERDAAEALERALEHFRRQNGVGSTLTLKELVNEYLAQYDAEPETIGKLGWLLAVTANPPRSRRASCRRAASTISVTRSQLSRSVPASQPSTSRVVWEPA